MTISRIASVLLAKRLLKARRRRSKFRKRMRLFMVQFFYILALSFMKKRIRTVGAYPRTDAVWYRLRYVAPEMEFREAFRVSKQTFIKLVNILKGDLKHYPNPVCDRARVTEEMQVGLTLYKLASCCEYRVIGNVFGLHKSTVCVYFHRVIEVIVRKLMKEKIKMPNEDECRELSNCFQDICGIPRIIACIDGSHIPILAPEDGRKDFLNRKHWASIILQATVDARCRFRDISVKFPGSCHDAFVFRNSALFLHHTELIPQTTMELNQTRIPYLILGDPAYPLLSWLMKDYYGRNLNEAQQNFNRQLNRARVKVEMAFGRLKGRWRILLKRADIHHTFMPKVVAACCVLHNFVEDENDQYPPQWNPSESDYRPYDPPPANFCQERDSFNGTIIRNELSNYISRL